MSKRHAQDLEFAMRCSSCLMPKLRADNFYVGKCVYVRMGVMEMKGRNFHSVY
jgi:hypothetical protein